MKTAVYVKTKLGKNLGKMLDYVGNDNRKPHYKSKNPKFLKSNLNHHDRVLDVAGVNCSSSYKEAIKEMDSTYKRFGYKKGHPQCVHTIIAFNPKDFDFTNYKDRTRALSMTQEIIRKKYPHNQSMIALQADNKNHILHTHTITCNKTIDSGKSVSHDASCERTLPYVQNVMKKYGYDVYNPFKPEAKPRIQYTKHGKKLVKPNNAVRLKKQPKLKASTNEFNLIKGNKKSYVTEIKNNFALAIELTKTTPSKSKNIQNLIRSSQSNGIQLSCFSMRKNKKTGKHEIHYYKNPPKHRAVKLPNGWARLRKTWSLKYHYKYKNKKGKLINKPITIRTSKMGSSFSPKNIMNTLGTEKIIMGINAKLVNMQSSTSLNSVASNVNLNSNARNIAKSMAKTENTNKASQPTNTSKTNTSSAPAKPTHQSAVKSKLSNDTRFMMNFNHHGSTQHFHKHNVQTSTIGVPNHKESTIVHSLDNEAQQNNKHVADSSPVMTFNHNQSSANSESETDDTVTQSSSKPRVSPAPMPFHVHIKSYAKHKVNGYSKLNFITNNVNDLNLGGHCYRPYHHIFKYPIFTSGKLENMIQKDIRTESNEDNRISELQDFENNCSKEDQSKIDARISEEDSYLAAKQSVDDIAKEIHKIRVQAKYHGLNGNGLGW